MTAGASPSVVRLRTTCPDLGAYRGRYEAEYALNGIFIPSRRPESRPVGARVHLKVELADRTLGYSGGAVVVRHVRDGRRVGYLLQLDDSSPDPFAPVAAETPPPTAPPAAAPACGPCDAVLPDLPDLADDVPDLAEAAAAEAAEELRDAELGEVGAAPEPGRAVETGPALPGAGRELEVELEVEPPPPPRPAVLGDVLFPEAATAGGPEALIPTMTIAELVPAPASPADPGAAAPGSVPASGAVAEQPPEAAAAGARPRDEDATFDLGAAVDDALSAARSAPAPRPRPRRGALALIALAVAGAMLVAGVAESRRRAAAERAFAAAIARADDRLQAGRLAAPRGDSALDFLEAARSELPGDPRLTARGKALADALESFGERALARGDLREAAAHFEAALRAEPARATARDHLETIARLQPTRRPAPR